MTQRAQACFHIAREFGLDYGDVLNYAHSLVHGERRPGHMEAAHRIGGTLAFEEISPFVNRLQNENRQDLDD